jgi:hypothetical protein
MNARRARRGSAVLLVLGLLAITLALSYALMRTQATTAHMQNNLNRRAIARAAAETGLLAALRRMHEDDWQGITESVNGALPDGSWYEAVYSTGDAALAPGDADYSEWPYRVTITATGHAADPARPGVDSTHAAVAVVQLVRRKLTPAPAAWNSAQNYTVYQWSASEAKIELPVRITGPVYLQSRIMLCERYPTDATAREGYLDGLEEMREASLRDDRPFNGPVSLPYLLQIANPSFTLLQTALDVPTQNVSLAPGSPVSHPGAVTSYRLYPGGQSYTIPSLTTAYGGAVQNVVLEPNVQTNPLGVFRTSASFALGDNVTLRGCIIAAGSNPDVEVTGRNVSVAAVDLPALHETSGRRQLPALIGADDFRVRSQGAGVLSGGAVISDDFEFERGATNTQFTMQGRLTAGKLTLEGRQPWEFSSAVWDDLWDDFDAQDGNPSGVRYFPQWALGQRGVAHAPLLSIEPPPAGVTIHWHDWTKPLFEKHEDDDGLCWDIVRWDGA